MLTLYFTRPNACLGTDGLAAAAAARLRCWILRCLSWEELERQPASFSFESLAFSSDGALGHRRFLLHWTIRIRVRVREPPCAEWVSSSFCLCLHLAELAAEALLSILVLLFVRSHSFPGVLPERLPALAVAFRTFAFSVLQVPVRFCFFRLKVFEAIRFRFHLYPTCFRKVQMRSDWYRNIVDI